MTVEEILALVGEYVTQRDHDIARMEAFGDDGFEASQAARQAITAALGPVMAVVRAVQPIVENTDPFYGSEKGFVYVDRIDWAVLKKIYLMYREQAVLSSRAPAPAPGLGEDQP